MSTSVIVMGAKGRMGHTICTLVKADPELSLDGVVERAGCEDGLDAWGTVCGTDLAPMLDQNPGAVVIDFTAPEASLAAARICAAKGGKIVIGTTGLTAEQQAELAELGARVPVFWSPNMSVGVGVLFKILPELVRLLGPAYDLEMVELHHNKKKDAPSGTALKLAECMAQARNWDLKEVGKCCREGIIGERPKEEIGVQTIRGGDVVGVHTVYMLGPGERIEVTHQAHSRENFASGALRAAKWLASQKPGRLYSIGDML